MDVEKIRSEFPFFANSNAIYFDNATTTHKPEPVLAAVDSYLRHSSASAGRGSHRLASRASISLEETRAEIADFINAEPDEIVFTAGSTYAMNTAAYSWGFYNLEDGDEILLCHDDHQSTILPWLHLSEILAKSGRKIKIIPINIHPHGDYDDDALAASLSPRTRTVIMTHIHSYFGMEMNIAANAANIRKYGKDIKIIIDGTQAAGHIPLDMKKLDCDFYCFSGHKMCALPGAGVLYAARRIHSELHPFIVGGRQKQDSLQSILENGTLNMPAIISLGASIKYLRKIGIQNIAEHISAITHRLANGLSQLPGLQMEKGASMCQCASHGICAFSIDGMTGADLAYILDDHDICVRANDFCLAKERRDTVRASLYFYNTETEVDRFLEIMERCPVPCKSANHLRHRLKT